MRHSHAISGSSFAQDMKVILCNMSPVCALWFFTMDDDAFSQRHGEFLKQKTRHVRHWGSKISFVFFPNDAEHEVIGGGGYFKTIF